jgi:hypothetical protein
MLEFRPLSLDLQSVSAALAKRVSRPVTDLEAAVWLRQQGFVDYQDQWIGPSESVTAFQQANETSPLIAPD